MNTKTAAPPSTTAKTITAAAAPKKISTGIPADITTANKSSNIFSTSAPTATSIEALTAATRYTVTSTSFTVAAPPATAATALIEAASPATIKKASTSVAPPAFIAKKQHFTSAGSPAKAELPSTTAQTLTAAAPASKKKQR
jgi:hypothetical protein